MFENKMPTTQNKEIIILENILTRDDVVQSINENLDYLEVIIPEIKDMIGFDHKHPHHHLDVWNHTLLALSFSENILEVRLTLLLHDIGKPHCFTEGKIRSFKGHPEISSIISRKILSRIGYDEDFIDEVCTLIKKHDDLVKQTEVMNDFELTYKRFLVQKCDALAHHPEKLEKRKKYIKETEKILKKRKTNLDK